MSPVRSYSRRLLLKLMSASSLSTFSVLGIGSLTVGCSGHPDLDDIAERMVETLDYPERAAEIGASFMKSTGAQSREALTQALLETLNLQLETISDEELTSLETQLRKRIRQDFEEENVVIVQGWMLSKTEATLCALTAASG